MDINKYILELDRLQEDGALIFIKWDGERNSNRKTVLIEKPGIDYLFRRDTDNLTETIKDGIADYDAIFKTK